MQRFRDKVFANAPRPQRLNPAPLYHSKRTFVEEKTLIETQKNRSHRLLFMEDAVCHNVC
jgi:hypothetical protein